MTQEQFRTALLEIKCDLLEKKQNRRNSRLTSSLGYLNGQIEMLNLILDFLPKEQTSEELMNAVREEGEKDVQVEETEEN